MFGKHFLLILHEKCRRSASSPHKLTVPSPPCTVSDFFYWLWVGSVMEHNPMEASNIVQSQFSYYLKHGLTLLYAHWNHNRSAAEPFLFSLGIVLEVK